jgi:hypothetical protein
VKTGFANAEWFKSDWRRRSDYDSAGRVDCNCKDGTVSTVPVGSNPNAVQVIGRLKLVNPPEENLVRGDDGLFKTKDGTVADADAAVGVAGGMLENSNVSVVESMVTMINLGRQFEMQMRLLQNAENNAQKPVRSSVWVSRFRRRITGSKLSCSLRRRACRRNK